MKLPKAQIYVCHKISKFLLSHFGCLLFPLPCFRSYHSHLPCGNPCSCHSQSPDLPHPPAHLQYVPALCHLFPTWSLTVLLSWCSSHFLCLSDSVFATQLSQELRAKPVEEFLFQTFSTRVAPEFFTLSHKPDRYTKFDQILTQPFLSGT